MLWFSVNRLLQELLPSLPSVTIAIRCCQFDEALLFEIMPRKAKKLWNDYILQVHTWYYVTANVDLFLLWIISASGEIIHCLDSWSDHWHQERTNTWWLSVTTWWASIYCIKNVISSFSSWSNAATSAYWVGVIAWIYSFCGIQATGGGREGM